MGGVVMQKYGLSYYKDSSNVVDLNIFNGSLQQLDSMLIQKK